MAIMPAILRLMAMASGAAVLAAASPAGAQDAAAESSAAVPAQHEQPNAARFYRKAADKARALPEKFREDMTFALAEFEGDSSRGPSLKVRQMLKRLRPINNLTMTGSRHAWCGFDAAYAAGDDQRQGFADVRTLLYFLGIDFLANVEDQDVGGATDELAAMYRIAAQMPQQHSLIGTIVGGAVIGLADWRLDIALDHAIIGPVEADALLREFQRFKGEDPMGYASALALERIAINDELAQRFSGEDAVEDFRTAYRRSVADDPATETALQQLTPERLRAMFADYARAAERMADAFDVRDADSRAAALAAIRDEMNTGEFAPLMGYFFAFDAVGLHDAMNRTNRLIDERRELLRGIAAGEIDPMSLANAAVWYVKAFRQVPNIDPVKRRAIDAFAARHDQPADAALVAILDRHDVQTVVATLAQAGEIDRCDWSYAHAG